MRRSVARTPALLALAALLGSLLLPASSAQAVDQPPRAGADGTVRSWLDEANYLRSFFDVPVPVLVEDVELSRKARLHAVYDSRNQSCGHDEDPANPHYTADGAYAAAHSVLWCGPVFGAQAVDGWVRTPIHGEQVLNPRLTVTGFSDAEQRSGMDTLTHGSAGPAITRPHTWPNGTGFPLRRWWGSESPDPLTACPAAYRASDGTGPSGQPFFVYLPDADAGAAPTQVAFGTADGTALPFCLLRRRSLGPFPFMTAAVLMPLAPLRPGTRYVARYEAGASVATWDVTTSPERTTLESQEDTTIRPDGQVDVGVTLRGEDGGLPGRELEVRNAADRALLAQAPVSRATTDANGTAQVSRPARSGWLEVRYPGGEGRLPSVATVQVLGAPVRVALDGPTTLTNGDAFRLEAAVAFEDGTAAPGLAVQLLRDGSPVADGTTGADGRVGFTPPYGRAAWTARVAEGPSTLAADSPAHATDGRVAQVDTRLRAAVSTSPASHGSTFTVSGRLSRPDGRPVPGEPVALDSAPQGGAFVQVATLTTDAQGLVVRTVTADRNRTYRVRYAGSADRYAPSSAQVQAPVRLRLTATAVRSGSTLEWKGRALPAAARSVRVEVSRAADRPWTTVSTGRTAADGTFRVAGPVRSGRWQYRVTVAGVAGRDVGASSAPRALVG